MDKPAFSLEPVSAEKLGFLYLGLGGSRVYRQWDQTSTPQTAAKIQDWDFIGFVESKDDILSRQHVLKVGSEPAMCQWGVVSSRKVRFSRGYHFKDGHRLFICQPLKLAESLFVLADQDFLHPQENSRDLNPGVLWDLFLTSAPLYQTDPHFASRLKATLLHKWLTLSKALAVEDMIPLLFRSCDFEPRFSQELRNEFTSIIDATADLVNSLPLRFARQSINAENADIGKRQRLRKQYQVVRVLEVQRGFWSSYCSPSLPDAVLNDLAQDVEFRVTTEHLCPSPFTSNSKGLFGEICPRSNAEWYQVFVKQTPHINDELLAFPDVRRHFPKECVQHILAANKSAQQIFFKPFEGKMLTQIRLEYCDGKSFLNRMSLMDAFKWFVEIELQRTEHISDTYRRTIDMNPTAAKGLKQRIHRFYFERLKSDVRFLEFYSETCPKVLGIHHLREMTTSRFLELPLIINGVAYSPLRHYLDRAEEFLNPEALDGLNSLPKAFGLGDGHGGNLMVTEDCACPKMMYLDYEVSGSHCPFLDMAKPIYGDGFFNVLYADLLCDDVSDPQNKSGAVVSWEVDSEIIHINYSLSVDEIGKTATIIKLEYLLRPVLELVQRDSTRRRKLADDVLGHALLACALLSRNFARRPDVFLLNLAVGVSLANNLRDMLYKVFEWRGLDAIDLSVQDTTIVQRHNKEHERELLEDNTWLLASLLSSSYLKPEEVFLKRAMKTFQLHYRFSRKQHESDGTMMRRISEARTTGMKVWTMAGMCILGLDLEQRFFQLGRKLYNEDGRASKLRFRQEDMLSPKFIDETSDLCNRFDFVHTANVIHLFTPKNQETFFRNLLHLAKPAGTIWGRQVGLADDMNQAIYKHPEGKGSRFTISEFRAFIAGITGWTAEDMRFEAQLVEYDELRIQRVDKKWVLQWSIRVPEGRLARDRIMAVGEA
ncbi:MAG: hypothetical protein Q9227_005064 [Pyrenula ochraceoflavens]